VTAALLALVLPSAPGRAEPRPVTSADLPRLTQELAEVTDRVEALTTDLDRATARDGGLRVAFDRADAVRQDAQSALDVRARQVYIAAATVPLGSWLERVASPDTRYLARRGQEEALRVDQRLLDEIAARSAQLAALQRQADAFRARLLQRARPLLAAQDSARVLLARAEALAAAEQAVEVQAQLARQRDRLDAFSTRATLALTPGQQGRARRALERELPVIALLEASGASYPAGYGPTGQVIVGDASWYGPGFVGNPTASGAPYDPERLTCAHKTLPLGTVVRVSRSGRAVSCLVNDRGPYVGDRVLDMSRAGSRALGYDGVARVTIEVLAFTG
jgi:rare lipoprotein A (peptidoglycan hydrolase)